MFAASLIMAATLGLIPGSAGAKVGRIARCRYVQ